MGLENDPETCGFIVFNMTPFQFIRNHFKQISTIFVQDLLQAHLDLVMDRGAGGRADGGGRGGQARAGGRLRPGRVGLIIFDF